MAHLSEKRLEIENKNWNDDIKKIRGFIKPIYKNFIENINNDYFPAIDKNGKEISKEGFEEFTRDNRDNKEDSFNQEDKGQKISATTTQ